MFHDISLVCQVRSSLCGAAGLSHQPSYLPSLSVSSLFCYLSYPCLHFPPPQVKSAGSCLISICILHALRHSSHVCENCQTVCIALISLQRLFTLCCDMDGSNELDNIRKIKMREYRDTNTPQLFPLGLCYHTHSSCTNTDMKARRTQ